MPARYTLPQNPFNGLRGLGGRGLGFDTGTIIPAGVTDFLSSTTTTDAIAASTGWPIPSLPNWSVLLGGAVVAWFVFMPSGSEYRGRRKALRRQYAGYRQVSRKTGGWFSDLAGPSGKV